MNDSHRAAATRRVSISGRFRSQLMLAVESRYAMRKASDAKRVVWNNNETEWSSRRYQFSILRRNSIVRNITFVIER